MLKLRRGLVVGEAPLTIEVEGERRPAWADEGLLGEMREGDEVIVNVEALDLGLGSGGLDIVHVNLSRGLGSEGAGGPEVIKLNYTSIQHPVVPVERSEEEIASGGAASVPVLVIPLHGQLAPSAWAAGQVTPGLRIGYVQTAGGALPGRISRDVAQLRSLGILCGHVTAGPAYGGELEGLSVAGAIDAAVHRLRWHGVIVGPGPGIIGSATHYGHGGMEALDNAHAALALGLPTLLSPRLSEADPRPRHRGVSHHTATVLGLLLDGVEVPVPDGADAEGAVLRTLAGERHRVRSHGADVDGYASSGLPTRTMGRGIEEDRIFFAAALAAGRGLGDAIGAPL